MGTSRRGSAGHLMAVCFWASGIGCGQADAISVPPAPRGGVPILPEGAAPASEPAPAAGDQSPEAVSGELPEPQAPIEPRFECKSDRCVLSGILPDLGLLKSQPEGRPSPAAVWQHGVAEGKTLVIPRHAGVDLLALVLSGRARASTDRGAQAVDLVAWDLLRAPGAGVALHAQEATELYLVLVSHSETLEAALDASDPPNRGAATGAESLERVRLSEIAPARVGKGAYAARVALGAPGGALSASFSVLTAAPGSDVPENVHPDAWEHIAILKGDGIMWQSGHERPVHPGAVYQVAPGSPHAYRGGSSAMAAILVFTPSGAEQRFLAPPPPE